MTTISVPDLVTIAEEGILPFDKTLAAAKAMGIDEDTLLNLAAQLEDTFYSSQSIDLLFWEALFQLQYNKVEEFKNRRMLTNHFLNMRTSF